MSDTKRAKEWLMEITADRGAAYHTLLKLCDERLASQSHPTEPTEDGQVVSTSTVATIITAFENWGRHFSWCVYVTTAGGTLPPSCNCGYAVELAKLRALYDAANEGTREVGAGSESIKADLPVPGQTMELTRGMVSEVVRVMHDENVVRNFRCLVLAANDTARTDAVRDTVAAILATQTSGARP